MLQAKLLKGNGDVRIGIFSQADIPGAAIDERFFQLLGTNNDLGTAEFRQIPALGYFTFFFSIHTKTYYTPFFKKVNKKIRKILYKLLISPCTA